MNIESAKAHLRENFEKGTSCPCCGQFVKLYKRKLHATMARMLIGLYRADAGEFLHIKQLIALTGMSEFTCGDFAKLTYWEFIEQEPKPDEEKDKRTSGRWKITAVGKKFVEGEISVPSHAKVFDSKFLGLAGDRVSIKHCLGEKFSYEELMS